MNRILFLILLGFLFNLVNCAGIYNEPVFINKQKTNSISKNIRLEFTGFYFYEKELNLLKTEILNSGLREDSNSPVLLEVILEEKEVTYKYSFLHSINLIASLFTAGIIPYYTITKHKITYRFSEGKKELNNTRLELELDQLRGLSLLPITPFFWPSSAFDKSILDSWKKQGEIK